MKVFKFGGASVRDADAVRNVANILKSFSGEKLIVVVSAMGKTTNALEEIHALRFKGLGFDDKLEELKNYHTSIYQALFESEKQHTGKLEELFAQLERQLSTAVSEAFDFEYDQIVCFGELLATAIVEQYIHHTGINSVWMDVRKLIHTDNRQRNANVVWNASAVTMHSIEQELRLHDVVVVQGFIGMGTHHNTTTLGREGSDFTAAILAFLLNAESVTIWKDVPGMLNADPKKFSDTVKLDSISYREAIELAYCGASVIHPKTVKPLQNKAIPLHIKSFVHPNEQGSVIQHSTEFDHLVPSIIHKDKQVLFSLSPKDFSFVVEDNLKDIFGVLSDLGIRIHLMENSAISFSFCMDEDAYKQQLLVERLRDSYEVRYNEHLTLITIRHYTEDLMRKVVGNMEILLEQRSRSTVRLVLR